MRVARPSLGTGLPKLRKSRTKIGKWAKNEWLNLVAVVAEQRLIIFG